MLVDNLKHVKMMEEAGFDEDQSRAIVEVWSNIVELDLVTKKDLKIAFLEWDARMEKRFKEIDKRFEMLSDRISALELKFEKFESTMVAKFAAMQVATIVILGAWGKFIN